MNFTKRLFFKSNSFNNLFESKNSKRNKRKNNLFNKLTLHDSNSHEENLFYNKSNIEVLLYQIKTVQEYLLLKEKSNPKITKNEKKKLYKNFLSDFKQNLIYMIIEKKTKELYLQKKLDDNKKIIQNKLFNLNKQIQNKKDNKEYQTEQTEVLEKNYGGNELSKLKMLNFIAENEIQKLNFIIQKKEYINNYLKITGIYLEEKEELIYDYFKINSKEIDDSYNYYIKESKILLNQKIEEKKEQNKEIKKYKMI